jgi:hypothetical protein
MEMDSDMCAVGDDAAHGQKRRRSPSPELEEYDPDALPADGGGLPPEPPEPIAVPDTFGTVSAWNAAQVWQGFQQLPWSESVQDRFQRLSAFVERVRHPQHDPFQGFDITECIEHVESWKSMLQGYTGLEVWRVKSILFPSDIPVEDMYHRYFDYAASFHTYMETTVSISSATEAHMGSLVDFIHQFHHYVRRIYQSVIYDLQSSQCITCFDDSHLPLQYTDKDSALAKFAASKAERSVSFEIVEFWIRQFSKDKVQKIIRHEGSRIAVTMAYPHHIFSDLKHMVFTYYYQKLAHPHLPGEFVSLFDDIYKRLGSFSCEADMQQWLMNSTIRSEVQHGLSHSNDSRFPIFSRCPEQLSWSNGLLKFVDDRETGYLTPEFSPYIMTSTWTNLHSWNGQSVRAAKESASNQGNSYHYIPQKFDFVKYNAMLQQGIMNDVQPPWKALPTPIMDKIFQDQNIPEEAIDMFHVMAGRMLFKVNQHDNWQVIGRIDGRAGTGKSTLLEAIRNLFSKDFNDVAPLNNTGRGNFQLQSMRTARIFICGDMDSNFSMPPAMFNEMVSGGTLQIDVMYNGDGFALAWDKPGFVAGNDPPNWENAGGCSDRRFITWSFQNSPQTNANLSRELRTELPIWFLKILLAYFDMVKKVDQSGRDLWYHLPDYFKQQREKLQTQLDPFRRFLLEQCITSRNGGEFQAIMSEPKDVFELKARNFYLLHSKKKKQLSFSDESTKRTLSDHGIQLVHNVYEGVSIRPE